MEELPKLINEEIEREAAQRLNPRDRVDVYLKIHEELLSHSGDEYAKGDLVQAGGKYWSHDNVTQCD
ncbi:hypothetical protein [Vulcanisaeta sp. JCM 16161]|uniref:hypothetical protein n=1 Tax=Vulcanisaeta sp. JCM 16161 TaxID=1295372 RepID=UPI00406C0DA0